MGCATHQAAEVVLIPCPVEESVIGVEKLEGSEGGAPGMALGGTEKMLQPLCLWKSIGIEQCDPIGFCFREGEIVGGGEAKIAARGDDAQIRQAAAERGAFSGIGVVHQKDGGRLESLRAKTVEATRQCLKRLPIDDDDCDLASVHFKQATGWRSWGEANHGLLGLARMIPRAGLAEKKQNHWVDAAALLATPPLAPALQKSPTADPDSPTHPSGSAARHHRPLWALAGQS